jgi:hypothetical protein
MIHVQILARTEEDIDEDVINAKLKTAIGANYDAGARKQVCNTFDAYKKTNEKKKKNFNRFIAFFFILTFSGIVWWRQISQRRQKVPHRSTASQRIYRYKRA